MEGSFGWGWVVDLKFVFHCLKPINTDIKYFLLKVEISNLGVLKESIAEIPNFIQSKIILFLRNRQERIKDNKIMKIDRKLKLHVMNVVFK